MPGDLAHEVEIQESHQHIPRPPTATPQHSQAASKPRDEPGPAWGGAALAHLLQPGLNGCQFILAQSESLAFFLSKVTEFSRSSPVFFLIFFWTHKPDFPLSFYFTGLEKKSQRERESE